MSDERDQNGAPRVTPAGWVPLSAAIAWVANGTAVTDWNSEFYHGANYWPHQTPQQIAATLRALLDGDYGRYRERPYLSQITDRMARAKAVIEPDEHLYSVLDPASSHERAPKARAFIEELIGSLAGKEEQYEALWQASEALRRAIAKGALPAFGFEGEAPDYRNGSIPGGVGPAWCPRKRIPGEACAAPVTVGRTGILPLARGDDDDGGFEYLWSEVLIEGEDLLLLRAAENVPSTLYTPQPQPDDDHPGEAELRGPGRPEDYDWVPYKRTLIAKLQEGGPGLTEKQLFAHLTEWAATNMLDAPDLETLRRQMRKVVPKDTLLKR